MIWNPILIRVRILENQIKINNINVSFPDILEGYATLQELIEYPTIKLKTPDGVVFLRLSVEFGSKIIMSVAVLPSV